MSQITRRDFLKSAVVAMTPLVIPVPIRLFIPPREPYVQTGLHGLNGLYSHLGVLPVSKELNICEGKLLEIAEWDGTAYPCLVENVCCGLPGPRCWIYDFDLWNFRHDDHLGQMRNHPECREFNSHAEWYAFRRFGIDTEKILSAGNGWIARQRKQRRSVIPYSWGLLPGGI